MTDETPNAEGEPSPATPEETPTAETKPFTYDDAVVKLVVSRCTEVESGGRMIDAILTNTILPRISEEYLSRMVAGRPLGAITLGVKNGDFSFDLA